MKLIFRLFLPKILLLLSFLFCTCLDLWGQVNYSARIIDPKIGLPISNCTIYSPKTQKVLAISNSEGFFSFTSPSDSIVFIQHIAYQDTLISLVPEKLMTIYLTNETIISEDVFVYERSLSSEKLYDGIRIDADMLEQIPSFLGQNDVLKTVQTLPGVSQSIEGFSQPVIRGGAPFHTQIMLNGIPLINPYHSGGFVSIVNPEIVGNYTFHNSAVPVHFGSTIGSVLTINTKRLSNQYFSGSVKAGVVSADIFSAIPLKNRNTEIKIALRKSTLNETVHSLDLVDKNVIPQTDFTDAFLLIDSRLSDRIQLNFTGFSSTDNVTSQNSSATIADNQSLQNAVRSQRGWIQHGIGSTLDYSMKSGNLARIVANYIWYSQEVSSANTSETLFDQQISQRKTSTLYDNVFQKTTLGWHWIGTTKNTSYLFGMESELYQASGSSSVAYVNPERNQNINRNTVFSSQSLAVISAFASSTFNFSENLTLRPELRSQWESSANGLYLSPSITSSFRWKDVEFAANVQRKHQFYALVSSPNPMIGTELFLLAQSDNQVQHSDQISLSAQYSSQNNMVFRMEGF